MGETTLAYITPPGNYHTWEVPDPAALHNVTGECAQLGFVAEYAAHVCPADTVLTSEKGYSCKLRPDKGLVSRLSRVANGLATEKAEAEAAATSSVIVSLTNVAVAATLVPVLPVVAAAVVFCGLPWLVSGTLEVM
jgi:hypothetical protein